MSESDQNSSIPKPLQDWISETWENKSDGMMNHQTQILNWVFTVNLGGVAGVLTFLSSGNKVCWAMWSLTLFSLGLLFLLIYGTVMFYFCARNFERFKSTVDKFYSKESPFVDFWIKANEIPEKSTLAEVFAWLSGLCAVLGVLCAINMI